MRRNEVRQASSVQSKPLNKKVSYLKNSRVVKKNLVYVIGLHKDHSDEKVLMTPEALLKYGDIQKIVPNSDKPFNRESEDQKLYSAYITFTEEAAAALAIIALTKFEYKNVPVKANFGMTKYCSYFLKGGECLNPDCLFLHKFAEKEDTYSKVA